MADKPPIDPLSLMQTLVSAWNQVAPAPAPPPPAEIDSAASRLMAQALAAANMPSREEVGGIAGRLDRIEAAIARIEHELTELPRRKKRKA